MSEMRKVAVVLCNVSLIGRGAGVVYWYLEEVCVWGGGGCCIIISVIDASSRPHQSSIAPPPPTHTRRQRVWALEDRGGGGGEPVGSLGPGGIGFTVCLSNTVQQRTNNIRNTEEAV